MTKATEKINEEFMKMLPPTIYFFGSSGNRVGREGWPLCSDRGGSEPCATSTCIEHSWG